MNLEELKKYKQELVCQKKLKVASCYFICVDFYHLFTDELYNRVFSNYTKSGIADLADTETLVKNCEEALKKYTKLLVKNFDENISKIALDAEPAIVLETSILKHLNEFKKKEIKYSDIKPYLLQDYAYFSFNLSTESTIIGNNELGELYEDNNKSAIEIVKNLQDFSGLVKYSDFIKSIQSLGYETEFYLGAPANTYQQYVNGVLNENCFEIIANFENKKVKSKKK